MKCNVWIAAIAAMVITPAIMNAQAPAGSTGQCKDGTYTNAASKSGACRGHKGIQTWYADAGTSAKSSKPAVKPAAAATPAPTPTPAPATSTPKPAPAPAPAASTPKSSTPKTSSAPSGPAAAGGGPGLVWVNTASNVYHCYGTKYYGKTKAGKYMSEADAKAAGGHPDHGEACSK
jgi:hypothetical protein